MLGFLKLIRYKNLLIIAGTQLLFNFFLNNGFFKQTALSGIDFFFLIFATICIAAGGNIINDICDVEIDKINKPEKLIVGTVISEKTANKLYIIITILGVAAGFYVSNSIGKATFGVFFILTSALLYFYATTLKKYFLWGNILISVLVGFSVFIIGIFDIIPIKSHENIFIFKIYFKTILFYTTLAFFINLLREIVKDIQDTDGDYNNNIVSLSIVLGKERSSKIIAILSLTGAICLFVFIYSVFHSYIFLILYFIIFVISLMFYLSYVSWYAKKDSEFSKMSNLLKIIMITGVLSVIPFHYLILKGF